MTRHGPSVPLQSLQLFDERRALQVQQIGGLALVAVRALERAPDQRVLEARRPAAPARRPSSGSTNSAGSTGARSLTDLRPADPRRRSARGPATARTSRSITFSSCRTLPGQSKAISACCASCASVTRPRGGFASLREPIEEVLREQRDVRAPLAQRRHAHRDDVQPVVQILAERALLDHLLADRSSWRRSTRTSTLTVCESPTRSNSRDCSTRSSFACSAGLIVPTSSRNSVPRLRLLEPALAVGDGAGERAAHVAEELGFEQRLGNRAAVDARRTADCAAGSRRESRARPAPCRCRSRR